MSKTPKLKRSERVALGAAAVGLVAGIAFSFVVTPIGGLILGCLVATIAYRGMMKNAAEKSLIDRL